MSAPASSGTTRSRPAGAARPEPLRTLLAEELAARFSEREAATSAHGEHFAHLWRLTAERAQGGKLVRPLLLLTAHRAMREATGRSWVDDAPSCGWPPAWSCCTSRSSCTTTSSTGTSTAAAGSTSSGR